MTLSAYVVIYFLVGLKLHTHISAGLIIDLSRLSACRGQDIFMNNSIWRPSNLLFGSESNNCPVYNMLGQM